jgi:hypothetical protein
LSLSVTLVKPARRSSSSLWRLHTRPYRRLSTFLRAASAAQRDLDRFASCSRSSALGCEQRALFCGAARVSEAVPIRCASSATTRRRHEMKLDIERSGRPDSGRPPRRGVDGRRSCPWQRLRRAVRYRRGTVSRGNLDARIWLNEAGLGRFGAHSSAGRASASRAEGQRFEPSCAHKAPQTALF